MPVLSQYYPSSLADVMQPIFVFEIGGEMIIMDFDVGADFAECGSDFSPAERPVEKESEWIRQLRAGVRL